MLKISDMFGKVTSIVSGINILPKIAVQEEEPLKPLSTCALGDVRVRPRSAVIRKEIIPFDATNSKHRKWYADFIETGSWASDAPRFEIEPMFSSRESMIRQKLIEYYMARDSALKKSAA